MSLIDPAWLRQGFMSVGDIQEDRRPAIVIQQHLSDLYGGEPFRINGWPQRGFRNSLWWVEKVAPNKAAASYMVKIDCQRSATLYVGINVEKGFEKKHPAAIRAASRRQPINHFFMNSSWDWHRAIPSLQGLGGSIQQAAKTVGGALYCWVEFDGFAEAKHFLITADGVFPRSGIRPVKWRDVTAYAQRDRPEVWGRLAIMRAFGVEECTPALAAPALLQVFKALRPIRDAWRGAAPRPVADSHAEAASLSSRRTRG